MKTLDTTIIEQALGLLGTLLEESEQGPYSIVVCGGAALISTGLVSRTTQDVDVVACMSNSMELTSPSPLPEDLLLQAERVRKTLGLPDNWLNNGPSSDEGGLFQMGLPEGLKERLMRRSFGNTLDVYFISRLDQIHLKLYASADQGPGRHVQDLLALSPSIPELQKAIAWARSHDPSDGFQQVLTEMLQAIGFGDALN